MSGLKSEGRTAPGACPRDAPELPSTANDRHQQQPANMKLARALNPRATHGNTLVMRRSLGGDEDQGAEVSTDVRDRRRARCVPERTAGPRLTGSRRRFALPAQDEKGDVVSGVLASDQGSHHRDADILRRPG